MDLRHWDNRIELMKRMAEASGRDLFLALARGKLSGLQLRSSAFRCIRCDHSDACRKLLESSERVTAVPQFCANKAVFDALPPLQSEVRDFRSVLP
ncbi:DUF6455 family protein [Pelagibacterium flavum]|uniref:DUF6455 family protein n=1 Tax=Pelagibacterium flavum TaxID=2984530 RepID=UPI0038CDC64F